MGRARRAGRDGPRIHADNRAAVPHASGAPAYALRVACADKVVAYSGDGAWSEALVEASADADLFICEAYTFNRPVRYHLDYASLCQHRDQLRCRQLVLTHMSRDMLHCAVDTTRAEEWPRRSSFSQAGLSGRLLASLRTRSSSSSWSQASRTNRIASTSHSNRFDHRDQCRRCAQRSTGRSVSGEHPDSRWRLEHC